MISHFKWMLEYDPVILAVVATTFTWLVTALGSSLVLFFKTINQRVLNAMLGFAVMMFLDVSLG